MHYLTAVILFIFIHQFSYSQREDRSVDIIKTVNKKDNNTEKTKNRFFDAYVGFNLYTHEDSELLVDYYDWVKSHVPMINLGFRVGKKSHRVAKKGNYRMAFQWTWYGMDIAYGSKELAVKFNIMNPGFTSVYTFSDERALEMNFNTGLSFIASHFKTAYQYFGMRGFPGVCFNPNLKFRKGDLSFGISYDFNLGFGDLFKKHNMNTLSFAIGTNF